MTGDRNGFVADLEADPGDALARLVYADFLQDQGDDFAAGALRGCERPRVIEHVPASDRERRFWVQVDGCKEVMALMAIGHALGVPRVGDAHPVYGYTLSGLSFELASPRVLEVRCTYY